MKETKNTVNTFWTGGVDSTYNLMRLLTTTTHMVQPHYIVRAEDSTGIEIDAMIRIRRIVFRRFPELSKRFLPPIYTNEPLIPDFPEIHDEIRELQKTAKVREQYKILARYCMAFSLDRVDVSVLDLHEESELVKHFQSSTVFKCFNYPLVGMTKLELFKKAKADGWDDILSMTSFCRRPVVKAKPCGVCGPCADAVSSGLGFRLPFKSRMKAWILIPFRNFYRKNYYKQDKAFLFKMIKRRFENKF